MEADCRCPNDCSSGCMTFWTEEGKTMEKLLKDCAKHWWSRHQSLTGCMMAYPPKPWSDLSSARLSTRSQFLRFNRSSNPKGPKESKDINGFNGSMQCLVQTCTNNMPMPHLVLHPPNAMLHVAGVGDTLEPCQHQYHAETEQHRTIISQNRTLKNFNT